jgi:hypothetical protein
MSYRHTQSGLVILVVCLAVGALGAAIMWRAGQMPMILMLVILVAVALVFHALTVEVDGYELRWYFSPGSGPIGWRSAKSAPLRSCGTIGGTDLASGPRRVSGSITCPAPTPSSFS